MWLNIDQFGYLLLTLLDTHNIYVVISINLSVHLLNYTMDYKLKAISNNIDNDRIIDLMLEETSTNSTSGRWESKNISSSHICEQKVPVLFSTMRGIHLRKFNKNSASNYSIDFCDLERWVRLIHPSFNF